MQLLRHVEGNRKCEACRKNPAEESRRLCSDCWEIIRKDKYGKNRKKRHRKTRKRKQQELACDFGFDRPMKEIKARVAKRNPNMKSRKVAKEARRIHKETASGKLCERCDKSKAKRGEPFCTPCEKQEQSYRSGKIRSRQKATV